MQKLNKHITTGTTCLVIGMFFLGIIMESIAIYQFNKAIEIAQNKEDIKSIKIRLILAWFLFGFTASTNFFSTSYEVLVGVFVGIIIASIACFIKFKKH